MSEKRFQETRIVDKWGGIYDSKTDEILDVNGVECKLNEQQAIIEQLEMKLELKTEEVEYLKRMMVKWGMIKDE